MQMPGRKSLVDKMKYGFNGKENDDEIKGYGNSVDFGARMYDPRIGRWFAVDPLDHLYPSSTPYSFALNTPIQAIDPDGRLVIFVNGHRFGFWRRKRKMAQIGRFNTKESQEYWAKSGNIDLLFKNRIGDYNDLYIDGHNRGLSSAKRRYLEGIEDGKAILRKITSGEIILKAGETIKIVSHSMGGAKSAGIIKVLTDAGLTVESFYDIAPKQPQHIAKSQALNHIQYSSQKDGIARQSPIPGAIQAPFPGKKDGFIKGHLLGNYVGIFDNNKEEEGYVSPRKDGKPVKSPGGNGGSGMGQKHFEDLKKIE
ncbi:MAG: RHS repeat domain-containing protein [Flavobacteriales bacterium]